MPAATCPPFPGSRLLNILGQVFSPVPLCIGSWKSDYWTGPVSRLALFFFNHWNSIWVEMMVIQFASSSSDISSSKGPAADKWCWKYITVSVVIHHCSFLLIPQNYLSYGVCHQNTGTIYLNTWFNTGHSACVYTSGLDMVRWNIQFFIRTCRLPPKKKKKNHEKLKIQWQNIEFVCVLHVLQDLFVSRLV